MNGILSMMEHIQQQEMQHQRQAPLSLDEVLRAVLAAASHGPERVAAEQSLRSWEADATPGFLHALVSIVQNAGQVDEVTIASCWCSAGCTSLQATACALCSQESVMWAGCIAASNFCSV